MKFLLHTDKRAKVYFFVGIGAIPACILALIGGTIAGLKTLYLPMALLMALAAAAAYAAPFLLLAFAERRLALRIGYLIESEGISEISELSCRLLIKEEAIARAVKRAEARGLLKSGATEHEPVEQEAKDGEEV